MTMNDAQFRDDGKVRLMVFFGFCWKASDQIGANGEIWAAGLEAGCQTNRVMAQMAALHPLKDQIMAMLHGQVQMRHQTRVCGKEFKQLFINFNAIKRGHTKPL